MNQCEAQKTAVKEFFKRHGYWMTVALMVLALPLVWLVWGAGGGQFFVDILCPEAVKCDRLEGLAHIGDVFGGINALFAALALAAVAVSTDLTRKANSHQQEWLRDEKYVGQVILSYEWAYNILTDNGSSLPPKNDPLKWQTCARHLVRAQKLSKLISGEEFRTILDDHEDFWRSKFHMAVDCDALKNRYYYLKVSQLRWHQENIDKVAAEVVFRFSAWADGAPDPLKELDPKELKALPDYASGLVSSRKALEEEKAEREAQYAKARQSSTVPQ